VTDESAPSCQPRGQACRVVGGRDRVTVVVDRGGAVQGRGTARPGQRLDGADYPQRGQLLGLAGDRPEAGPVDQPRRLSDSERTLVGAGRQ